MTGFWRAYTVLAALSFLLCSADAVHAKRVALVVGVSNYVHSPKLANPGNDAADVARALSAAGFLVTSSLDEDLTNLLRTVERFYEQATGAEAAVFFFAGHGLQFEGVNYLVPRDARLTSEARLKHETMALQDIISGIEKRAKVTLAFLDACRDNPLAEELQRSALGKDRSAAVPRGLAPMRIRNPDTLVVFAATPGRTASDGAGKNSPFTKALLNHMEQPDVEIELMMKRVTRDVHQSTKGDQTPERLSRLTSEFYFLRKAGAAVTSTPVAKLSPTRPELPSSAARQANCVEVSGRLKASIPISEGTEICSPGTGDRAIIKRIHREYVEYSENRGFAKSCDLGQLCRFGWRGSPLFVFARGSSGSIQMRPHK